jgi:cysteine desulfurase
MTYLDHNATTPLAEGLSKYILPYLEGDFGNPSSQSYELGRRAKAIVERSREAVASLVDSSLEEVAFTSGGTESINLAILGVAMSMKEGDIILRSAVEHPAVKEIINFCVKVFKIKEEIIPVDKDGALLFDKLVDLDKVRLASVMFANNETGILHDLLVLKSILPKDALVHVDATQGIGKVPFSFKTLGIDLCSFSGHKFSGPKGVGALILKEGINWQAPMSGGGQERGRRGGTESVPLIAGLGFAAEYSRENLNNGYSESIKELRDTFESKLKNKLLEIEIVGGNSLRLPNTSNVLIPGVVGSDLVKFLGEKDICISAGSACKASTFTPSPVLSAMGYSSMSAVSGIRVSFGHGNTREDIDKIVSEISNFCKNNNKLEGLLSEGK